MVDKDKKIQEALDKVEAKLSTIKDDIKACKAYEFKTGLVFHGQNVQNFDLEMLFALYLEISTLSKEAKAVSTELGGIEFKCMGNTPEEWLEDLKVLMKKKTLNKELDRLLKLKKDLESHFTDEYREEKIVIDLIGRV